MTPAATEAPETAEEPVDPELPYGDDFEQLPDQLVNALRETIKEFQGQERYQRRAEVRRDWKNRLYELGSQHVVWQSGNGGGFVGITPGGTLTNSAGGISQASRYIDSYNLYRRYLYVNMSILTQNPPGIKWEPKHQDRAEDQEAASTAEGYQEVYARSNNVKAIQTQVARMMGVSGRTVAWTHTEADAQRFGINPETQQPWNMETTSIYGTIETKIPILAKSHRDCLYCFISDDPDILKAKAEYPQFKDEIKPGVSGLGENNYERLARLGILQGSRSGQLAVDSYTHLVTRMRCWLRPECFTDKRFDAELEDAGGTQAETVGERLLELFHDGIMVTFVGDVYVCAKPQSMDDAIVIGFPSEGDGMSRAGFMDSFLVIQDAFNDARNTCREIWDVGFPSTWVGADDTEYDAIVKQRADPYAIRQKKLQNPMAKMVDSFFREPNPELPATFIEDMELLQGSLPQFMLAAPPALFGASMQDQQTASGYAQARAQAMGQQGLLWQPIQWMFARIYYQAAVLATKNPDHAKPIAIPGGSGALATIEIGKMTKGQFGCYPDEDSSFPESTEQKRATFQQLIQLIGPTPIGMQMLQAPRNLKTFLELEGFPEIEIPEATAWDKQMFEIEQLLRTSPMPPPPQAVQEAQVQHATVAIQAQGAGAAPPPFAPPPPQSTVPVNDWDFHQWEAAACQDWLNSEDCRKELANNNTAGVANVVLHWRAHVAAAATSPLPGGPPMMPPPPPGAPPKPLGAPQAVPGISATM